MSEFEYAKYTYESELNEIEKALGKVSDLIDGLRLNDKGHYASRLYGILDDLEIELGVDQ
jgi:hypothetical protein